MASLIVGGVPIKIAAPGITRPRLDGVDRARAFDLTYRASATGNAKREWDFSTPPITREWSDFYERVLARIPAQACTGDVIGGSSNLFTFAEDLDNAAWIKTRSSFTANATTAPDGTTTADKLVENTAVTTDHYFERNFSAAFTNANQAWSFFTKAGERSWLFVRSMNKAGVFANRFVNIGTGVLGSSSGGAQTVTVTPYWNGWYRIVVVFDAGSGGSTPKFEVALATGDGGQAYTGDGTSGAYFWGFQHDLDVAVATSYAGTGVSTTLSTNCCSEITGWTPVRVGNGHYVVLDFTLHE